MKKILMNISNHPSSKWSTEQKEINNKERKKGWARARCTQL